MATYIRLTDYKSSGEKEQEFFNPENRYEAKQEDFSKIPTSPIAYWVSDKVKIIFEKSEKLKNIATPKQGMSTSDNDRFLRLWTSVDFNKIGFGYSTRNEAKENSFKWFPYNKGGEIRKWYGNNEYLVNFKNDGEELFNLRPKSVIRNPNYYFLEGITWGKVTTGTLSVRNVPIGYIFSDGGMKVFIDKNLNYYLTSFLNSKLVELFISVISPTLNYEQGNISALPFLINHTNKNRIDLLTEENIKISKEEWDSRETSWDFTKNELIKHKSDSKIETAYSNYCNYWKEQFNTLHQNEEELNRLFIDIYELQDELDEYVDFKDITILKNETEIQQVLIPPHTIEEAEERAKTPEGYMYNSGAMLVFKADEIMKQFISYGVGVMFGRYSLDSDGLLIANMGQEVPTSTTFEIDDDNVIPVLEDDYFKDDIASRFVAFVKVTFGEEDLSENIRFIESSLGTTLRKYFVKGFYEDHIKRYKKRPIYWMVASPKKGFMSLIYMHRYQSDIFARIQNSYLREYITKLEATLNAQTQIANDENNSTKVRKDAQKQIDTIHKKMDEIIKYDRDHLTAFAQGKIEIDLDDGVKVNYCKFKDVLYPIVGLCK